MKKILFSTIFFFCIYSASASHITGGEIFYDDLGASATGRNYRITMRLFRDDNCFNCATMPPSVGVGIYNNDNGQLMGTFRTIPLASTAIVPINPLPSCITNPPTLTYTMGNYILVTDLPSNTAGYTVVYQTCCRINGIANTNDRTGATYSANIPGSMILNNRVSSSPRFSTFIDVVCYNQPFTLDFSATDPDGDSLVYSLCSAYDGGPANNSSNPAAFATPVAPPYQFINYTGGFSGVQPLGPNATINSQTGIITGTAPGAGRYVVSVCISSYRNGVFIGDHKKDFIITVAPCDFSKAELDLEYINCQDFNFDFKNNNNSPLNLTFYWEFGDGNSSTQEFPTHTYAAAGTYTVKLVVNRGGSCSDSMTSQVKVYPGFFPAFAENSPMCKNTPVQFTDGTTLNHGAVNYWKWDFGIPTTNADTSNIASPQFVYPDAGSYNATLIVGSDRGCRDTIQKTITILEKPPFTLSNDTLICVIDTLQISANSNSGGSVTWTPNYMISNVNSFTPLVSPDVTTTYYANYADNFGCTAVDSVTISVVTDASLIMPSDTAICRTDSLILQTTSNALYYVWSPDLTLNDGSIASPTATPTDASTTYTVLASISNKCFRQGSVTVQTVSYPLADAGPDQTICYGTSTALQATGGSAYSWTPVRNLSNPTAASTNLINPPVSGNYIVHVTDTLGCPKPDIDTVFVEVVRIIADAGPSDTSIVIGQPLQLNATGSTNYSWTPGTWLSHTDIADPIAEPQDDINYIVRVSNDIGCESFDTIRVKVYTVPPDLYVPTAFTPGADGTNDLFRPIALGIKSLESFRVFNRWGQQVFATSSIGHGWNGKFGGKEQGPGTYVWYAEATDYLNNKIRKKGTVILIR